MLWNLSLFHRSLSPFRLGKAAKQGQSIPISCVERSFRVNDSSIEVGCAARYAEDRCEQYQIDGEGIVEHA